MLRSNDLIASEDDIFRMMTEWMAAEPGREAKWGRDVVPLVRFPQLSPSLLGLLEQSPAYGLLVQTMAAKARMWTSAVPFVNEVPSTAPGPSLQEDPLAASVTQVATVFHLFLRPR